MTFHSLLIITKLKPESTVLHLFYDETERDDDLSTFEPTRVPKKVDLWEDEFRFFKCRTHHGSDIL